jgi:hypothetical protein
MNSLKDYIPLITLIVTFFTFAIIYWRENRKQFQDKIFEYKYLSYKEIITELGIHYETLFSLQQNLQDFEGTEEEWANHFQETCGEWYDMANEVDKLRHKHGLILPDAVYEKLVETTQTGIQVVTVHFHFDNAIAINSVDKYWEKYLEFIEVARQDLNINKLNLSLVHRLTDPFYPMKSPFKKRA